MRTSLERYFAQRVKNLFNHLYDLELNGNEVSLHDLRVELKKMKAVIKFLRNIYPDKKLKTSAHLLQNIFLEAGKIRELQLMHAWLQKNKFAMTEQIYFPACDLHQMIETFQKNIRHFKKDCKEIVRSVEWFVHKAHTILTERYFAEINEQVEKKRHKNLPLTEWHELRKLIKQRTYAYDRMLHETDKADPHFAFYHKLQGSIGLWHDLGLIKEALSQNQLYLSQNIQVQKDLQLAWGKLNRSLKYREKKIEALLAKPMIQR